jgi:hypothetical protein
LEIFFDNFSNFNCKNVLDKQRLCY